MQILRVQSLHFWLEPGPFKPSTPTFDPRISSPSHFFSISNHAARSDYIVGTLQYAMERLSGTAGPCLLVLLPIELRQQIYTHLFLTQKRRLDYCDVCGHVRFNPGIPLQIQRVCSQLRSETQDWFSQCATQLADQHERCQVYVHRCMKCANSFPESECELQQHLVPLKFGRMIWQARCLSSSWSRYFDPERTRPEQQQCLEYVHLNTWGLHGQDRL